jgi:hypothetical protein
MTQEEYLELINSLESGYEESEIYWIPAESDAKSIMLKKEAANKHLTLDILNYTGEEIKEQLTKNIYFIVGNFKVKIKNYSCNLTSELLISLELREEKLKTPNCFPCKVDYPIRVAKDSRFKNCSWCKYFIEYMGNNLTEDKVVEILRYLQFTTKHSSFI